MSKIRAKDFCTKTIIQSALHPSKHNWNIGLDIGYSSVKGYSPNSQIGFPTYAVKKGEIKQLGNVKSDEIVYRDDITGEEWYVGSVAQEIGADSTNDSELAVYNRNRYFSDIFLVTFRTGLGLSYKRNKVGSPVGPLHLCMGLPPEFLETDKPIMLSAIEGNHKFSVKVGESEWYSFDIDINKDDVDVLSQPMGSLYNVATTDDGKVSNIARDLFTKNVLIFDAGFGTLDLFNIKKGKVPNAAETMDNLGMKEVFHRIIRHIGKEGTQISMQKMQEILATGKYNRIETKQVGNRTMRYPVETDVTPLLEKYVKEVGNEAINRVCTSYNDLIDHNYLILTGGTSCAWKELFEDTFEPIAGTRLKIISTESVSMGAVFANAKGYYMYALTKEK